jgi:hypothetical protein
MVIAEAEGMEFSRMRERSVSDLEVLRVGPRLFFHAAMQTPIPQRASPIAAEIPRAISVGSSIYPETAVSP